MPVTNGDPQLARWLGSNGLLKGTLADSVRQLTEITLAVMAIYHAAL